jgi:Protein of unknown function (DUF4065)
MMIMDRTKHVAHYIIARAKPEHLGATKLNKVMWFADLISHKVTGKTITGQTSYRKLQYGPVPNEMVSVLRSLMDDGAIVKREVPTPLGSRHEYVWIKEPELDLFSAQEIDIINQMIDWVCNDHTASSISEFTHGPLWEETLMGDQIDIGAASVSIVPTTGKHLEWALSAIERHSEVH